MRSTSEAKKLPESQEQPRSEARDPNSIGARLRGAASNIGETTVETAARTTDTAAEIPGHIAQLVAYQGQEAVRLGLRMVAGAQGPFADLAYDQSRRLVETTARVANIYYAGAQHSAEDIQALAGAFSGIGRGLQQYQQTYFDQISWWLESFSRKRQDSFQATSPVELAAIQRDLYLDTVNSVLTGTTTLLQLMGQIAQDAARPLKERARHTDKGTTASNTMDQPLDGST